MFRCTFSCHVQTASGGGYAVLDAVLPFVPTVGMKFQGIDGQEESIDADSNMLYEALEVHWLYRSKRFLIVINWQEDVRLEMEAKDYFEQLFNCNWTFVDDESFCQEPESISS